MLWGKRCSGTGTSCPAADRDAWTARFAEMAEYLCQNIEKLGGNINYPITCAYTMALAARLLGGAHFAAKAKQLADFAVAHITPDGLLYGEGHCMTTVTPKNCRPVDLGYNVEESLPALILYAELTEDETGAPCRAAHRAGTPQLYAARRRVGQQLQGAAL